MWRSIVDDHGPAARALRGGSRGTRCLILCVLSLSLMDTGAQPNLRRWDLRYPSPPHLGHVVFAENTFVGVPVSGTGPPFTSRDGIDWVHASVEGDTWRAGFSDVAFGNGRFFGVTRSGGVFTSENTMNWTPLSDTPVADGSTNRVIHVAAGNGVLVTASEEGGVSASTDGITWTFPQLLDGCPRRLWFGNGTFLAVGTCGAPEGSEIWMSVDGVTWSGPADPVAQRIRDASFSDGLFTGVSADYEVLTSVDGTIWQVRGSIPVGFPGASAYVIHANGRFVALEFEPKGESFVLSSTNGTSWTVHEPVGDARTLAYGNGLFVVAGRSVFVSPDAVSWTRSGDSRVMPTSVAYGNGAFVAAGGNELLYSSDGTEWGPVRPYGVSRLPVGVYFENGMFIGPTWPSFKPGAQLEGAVLISSDGLTWSEHTGPPVLSSLRSIVYGNGVFVAIGDGNQLLRSTDGIHWIDQEEVEFVSQIVFGNGFFLASAHSQSRPRAYDTFIYGSADGKRWRRLTVLQNQVVHLNTFGLGVFVAQSLEGPRRHVLTSRNGIEWTTVFTGRNPGVILPAYANSDAGVIVLLSPFSIVSSPNGVTWAEQSADSSLHLAENTAHPALAYGRGTFVTVNSGGVQQSRPVPPRFWVSVVADPSSTLWTGTEPAIFHVRREGSTSTEADLQVAIELGGTAQPGVDYDRIGDSVVIPAGRFTTPVRVTPIPDPLKISSKTVELTIATSAAYGPGDPDFAVVQIDPHPDLIPRIPIDGVVRLVNGATLLRITSVPGATLIVEASEDLIAWVTLTSLVSPTGLAEFTDLNAGESIRFYRVRLSLASLSDPSAGPGA